LDWIEVAEELVRTEFTKNYVSFPIAESSGDVAEEDENEKDDEVHFIIFKNVFY
jgi:hypothetical protein